MITHIKIDGFKSFKSFEMDFTPMTVIAGANASGKSNLFDALKLLSRLAETDLKTAFSEQRGDAIELFTQYDDEEYARQMSFAVEMLVNRKVKDNWGGKHDLSCTRLRYELVIERQKNGSGTDTLTIAHESLKAISVQADIWVKNNLPESTRAYWHSASGGDEAFIFTENKNGISTIKLAQENGVSGKEMKADEVVQTVLSGINDVGFPHAFAAKEEMRSWKFLQLNPEVLREPTRKDLGLRDTITESGDNLAAALFRIQLDDKYILKEISRKINNILPNLTEVNVYDDKPNNRYIIKIRSEEGREFSSRVLSEGTLRLLTLCVFQYDNQHNSLLCYEEPENGIHPFRIEPLVSLLKDLSVDFKDTEMPLRQLIVNTHSPVLIGKAFELKENSVSIWLSKLTTIITENQGEKTKIYATRMLPVESPGKNGQQILLFPNYTPQEKKLTINEARQYLETANFELTINELTI